MSYRGWKNWATYACNLHFGDEMEDIYKTAIAEIGDNENDLYVIFKDESKSMVENTVKNMVAQPEIEELRAHMNEIDYYEIFQTIRDDCS